jgi:YesN/AraC family two-component response regulator
MTIHHLPVGRNTAPRGSKEPSPQPELVQKIKDGIGKPQAPKVLAVDDEPGIRQLQEGTLSQAGYDVVTADSVDGALEIIAQDGIGLVLADIRMPWKTGIDLLKEVSSSHPNVGVIMVSGVTDLGIAMDAIRLGAYDYITKPLNVDDMLVKVQRAVERHRLVTENAEYQKDLERIVQERTAALERRMGELTALNRMYRQYLEDDLSNDAKLAAMSKSFFELAGQLQSLTEEKERRRSGEGTQSSTG